MAFTFRPSDKAAKALEKIKKAKNITACSKVLEYVLIRFQSLEKELSETRAARARLENELNNIKWTIIRKQKAAREFAAMVNDFDND
ncbi:MAG: hypothetical protein HOE02_05555 [Candidatus Marinimicrobia bacterium]|jgi:predicted RNase H-like nuclease (RuvC/YqgF family)|nr:hypothetical protein [Candidatus Neomarinimicrobiota bacterium]